MEGMIPTQRMKKAMDRNKPDRVPVMCQMSIGHMLLQTGFSPSEFWFSKDCFAEGLLKLRKAYGFDGILISLHGHSPDWARNIVEIKREQNEEIVVWKNGDRTIFPPDELPRHHPSNPTPPPEVTAFNPDVLSEDISFIPVSQSLQFSIDPDHPYDIIEAIVDKAGGQFSIHGEVTSPFDYLLNLFGHNQALIALIEEPIKCEAILQHYTQGVAKIASGQARRGVDAVKISSPYAGSGFISPAFYRQYVLPYEKQVADAVKHQDVHVYTHTCGGIGDRLEMMTEAGISGIECLDPPPLGNVSLTEAKNRVGGRVFIKGNIDPIRILLQGTKEQVHEDVRDNIAAGKPGGGYILSTACSIAPHTLPENIRALAEVAEETGSY